MIREVLLLKELDGGGLKRLVPAGLTAGHLLSLGMLKIMVRLGLLKIVLLTVLLAIRVRHGGTLNHARVVWVPIVLVRVLRH